MRPTALRLIAVLAAGLAGCATVPPESEPEARAEYFETNDPIEPLNRVTYAVNDAFDVMLFRPAAEAYRLFLGAGNGSANEK